MNPVVQRINRAKRIAKALKTHKAFATELLNHFENVDELLECFGAPIDEYLDEYLEENRIIEYEEKEGIDKGLER